MNIDGLTNKQLLTAALRELLDGVEKGLVLYRSVEAARAALLEVDRPKGTARNRPKKARVVPTK